ncbi:MAG: heme-binding protein [Verrucomicrobiota bacterium]
MRTTITALVICTGVIFMSSKTFATEQAYPKTAVDKIEIKELPEARLMVTQSTGNYFAKDNDMFGRLFRYISSNQVAMTTPVEAEFQPASMRFYVGADQKDKELKDHQEVTILTLPMRHVAAIGGRGAYSKENITAAQAKLTAWLKEQTDYVQSGEPYGVFWNSPFVPWFLKRYEVQVAVKLKK